MTNRVLYFATKPLSAELRKMNGMEIRRLLDEVYGDFAEETLLLVPDSYDIALKIAILVDRGLYQFADYGVVYELRSVGNRAWRVLQNMLNDGGPERYLSMNDEDFIKIAVKAAREEH